MLKLISCEAFKIKDPIYFHNGLNTIVGDGNNSIGKSTFLMIIDFVFGGEDYLTKEKETIASVGPHEIKFAFEFDDNTKYFIRNTTESTTVYLCDENFNKQRSITLDAFRNGLAHYYGLDKSDLTLRGYISPYFRIYNRGTHNELKPFNSTVREPDQKGVIALLKMYDLFEKVEALNKKYNDDNDLKREFDNMKRFKVAPIATTKEEYEQFQKELSTYEKELVDLHIDNSNGSADAELIVVQKIDDLKRQKKELRKEKSTLERQLNNINFDQNYSEEDYAKRYSALTKFFPNVNIAEIKQLEKFHIDVVSFLKEQSNESNNEIAQLISVIDEQIEKIDKELQNCKNVETLPKEILRRYGELVTLIQEKKTAIENYEKHQKAKADAEQSKKERDESVDSITYGLQEKINAELKSLNGYVRSELKNIAPQISINSLDSYAFFIKNDSGTGSRFKSVCLLDLVILKQTLLPAFAHDSIMFANIEAGACVDLFKLYASNETKQTFVGVDNAYHYRDFNGLELIEKSKVLQLALGEELFGQRFNKQEE